jgi:hypothetical protein
MLLALARALEQQPGHPLEERHIDMIRGSRHLALSKRAANTAQYARALLRVVGRKKKWLRIANEQGQDAMLRYVRKSIRWEARRARSQDEDWPRRQRPGTGRRPGRPGRMPEWVQSPRLTELLASGRLPPEQVRVARALLEGLTPRSACRAAKTKQASYDALRRKVLR